MCIKFSWQLEEVLVKNVFRSNVISPHAFVVSSTETILKILVQGPNSLTYIQLPFKL